MIRFTKTFLFAFDHRVGISAISCLGVTLFAFKTKFDFTSCFGVIFVLFVVMVLFGLVLVFVRITALHQVKQS